MIGERFKSLTVLALDEEYNKKLKEDRNKGLRNNAPIHYICQCDCGHILRVSKNSLKHRKIDGCEQCFTNYFKDYIGTQINGWFIQDFIKKNNKSYFKCICNCGVEKVVNAYNIINNKSKDCGCGRKEILKGNIKDLSGMKFGRLTVLENTGEKKNGKYIYKCQCECGQYCYIRSSSLTSNHTISCGCVVSKYNNIIIDILSELGYECESEYYVDLKDYVDDVKYIRFDVYIPLLNLTIEYDGEFHYMCIPYIHDEQEAKENLKRTQYRDSIKNKYCIDNNIHLLRIPYTENKNIKDHIINAINNIITCND